MGMIHIQMRGSFPERERAFRAQEYGHARAVANAIRWLAEQLPDAIRQDHDLHEQGHKPDKAFGRD
jgi:hypothetical protein